MSKPAFKPGMFVKHKDPDTNTTDMGEIEGVVHRLDGHSYIVNGSSEHVAEENITHAYKQILAKKKAQKKAVDAKASAKKSPPPPKKVAPKPAPKAPVEEEEEDDEELPA